MTRAVTLSTLGAWVIKCNPARTPVEPMLRSGLTPPRWCVADNYRTRLMRPGHRVLFWVAAHPRRGFWGAGHITGDVVHDDDSFRVPVHIPLLAAPLAAEQLAQIPDLRSLEVLRSPQQSNPSWVSATQLMLLEPVAAHHRSLIAAALRWRTSHQLGVRFGPAAASTSCQHVRQSPGAPPKERICHGNRG